MKAGLDERIDGRLHFRDQYGFAVLVDRFVLVGLAVVRGEEVLGDAAGGVDGRVEGFAAVVGKAFALGQAFCVQYFVEFERKVARAEQSLGHGKSSVYMQSSLRRRRDGCLAPYIRVMGRHSSLF